MFHPFYVKNEDGTGQWKAASNLEAGDELLTEDGKKVFVSEVRVEKLEEEITVYNLELDEVHTYYVALGVLVHNMCAKKKKDDDGPNVVRVGKNHGNTPRDNSRQNKQIKAIARLLNLSNDDLEILHELISHQGLSYKEILDLAKEYFDK